MKNSFTFYESTILNAIDFDSYEIETPKNNFDKVKKLHRIFLREYGFMIERVGKRNAFSEYLMGLPSVCTVPFYNGEIIENAEKAGLIKKSSNDNKQQHFIDNYFTRLSGAFWTLFSLKENISLKENL